MGGGIDFWSSGWLEIDLYDYEKEKLIINVLLEPTEEYETHLKNLIETLKSQSSVLK